MRLLFDENLSPKLCLRLNDLYPGSESVIKIGLGGKPDGAVWQYAVSHGMIIVSKDADFLERAIITNSAAKFVWLRLGNCTTESAEQALRVGHALIHAFSTSTDRVIEFSNQ